MTMEVGGILWELSRERRRQDEKWSVRDQHPMEWLSILGEEYGEACRAANEGHWENKGYANYRKELIETAAVAIAAIECLDRGKWNKKEP